MNTMKKHKKDRAINQISNRRPLLLRFSSITLVMKLIPNRMRVLMDMQTQRHNQAGGIWRPSAFPLSVEILSGTRLVRTGTASHPLDAMDFPGLSLCSTHSFPHTFTHSVLAIVRFLLDLICGCFSEDISECLAVARHLRASNEAVGYTSHGLSFSISIR